MTLGVVVDYVDVTELLTRRDEVKPKVWNEAMYRRAVSDLDTKLTRRLIELHDGVERAVDLLESYVDNFDAHDAVHRSLYELNKVL